MRTLEQLGISPAPWQVHDDDRVLCTKSPAVYSVCNRGAYVGLNEWAADASLIAAAPKLYEALREAVIEFCHDCEVTKINQQLEMK